MQRGDRGHGAAPHHRPAFITGGTVSYASRHLVGCRSMASRSGSAALSGQPLSAMEKKLSDAIATKTWKHTPVGPIRECLTLLPGAAKFASLIENAAGLAYDLNSFLGMAAA